MSNKTPLLVLPKQYLSNAIDLVNHAKARVYLTTLSIFADESTEPLIQAVIAAAKRGLDVHIMADFVTFMYAVQQSKTRRQVVTGMAMRRADQLRKRLKRAGVTFYWLGSYNVPLCVGRTHSKWCVIDDTVFTFGGVNLEREALRRADFMLKVTDTKLANRLVKEQHSIEQIDNQPKLRYNSRVKLNYGTLLIDGGRVNHSIIYNRAAELAKMASSIILVSQYCPNGKLGKIIAQKPNKLYFNRKNLANSRLNQAMIGLPWLVNRTPNLYRRNRYIHAKFIIFTMPDNSKLALTGSHNFTSLGSFFGTREIALETTDKTIISQLERFVKTDIA